MSKLLHYRLNETKDRIEAVTESKGLVYIRPIFSKDIVDILSPAILDPVAETHDITEHRRVLAEFVSAATCIHSVRNMLKMASGKDDIFGPEDGRSLVIGDRLGSIGVHVTNGSLRSVLCIPHSKVFGFGATGNTIIADSKVAPDEFVLELTVCLMSRLKELPDELATVLKTMWEEETEDARTDIMESRQSDIDDGLMNSNQVCNYLSISLTSLGRYMAGRVPKGSPEFPKPDWYISRGKRWRKSTIDLWMQSRIK